MGSPCSLVIYARVHFLSLHYLAYITLKLLHSYKGSFNNYVDKKRGEGVSRKFTLGHMTKGRYPVKCPQLSTHSRSKQRTDQRVLVLTLKFLALTKSGFSPIKNTSKNYFDFCLPLFYAIDQGGLQYLIKLIFYPLKL